MNKPVVVMSERDRQILNRIRQKVVAKGIAAEKVQPSYLRVPFLTAAEKSEYLFPIRKDSNSVLPGNYLDQNDSFVITDLGMMLQAEAPATPGISLLQTYPNNQVFVAAVGEVNPLHLNIFYNGKYKVKVDDTVYADAIPTNNMLCVRTTQQASATTFSERFGKDGTVPLTPDITLDGSRKNEITLTVPTFPGLQVQHTTAATRISVVFYAYGFLITGGSNLGNL